ncbi:hypothetical protein SAMN05444266_101208 [Chitinophaga jiangningensis]|uniref:LiaF transmembrane domain-containing protein n=1 Tax=Chitinophaga jiangningensis TaxID=1419482 RepID=A0A1M6VH29_9BACT|nr:hypothetical protein [Chitinophaga jiangningensis]SHK80857.1 hypothetical protein SAMN05444266_101208 [Chitinophaga jiangningensis]
MANTVTQVNSSGKGRSGVGGIFLIILGIALLVNILNLDVHLGLPHWISSWQVVMMVVGLLVGIKRNFQGIGWAILMGIGGIFFIKDILHVSFLIDRFIWPVGLILLGVIILSRKASARKRG